VSLIYLLQGCVNGPTTPIKDQNISTLTPPSILPKMISTVPGTPTISNVVAGNGQATISFTPPTSNGGSPITLYTVTSSSGRNAVGYFSPIIMTNLLNGTSYTFTVKASNYVGASAASAISNSVLVGSTTTTTAQGNITPVVAPPTISAYIPLSRISSGAGNILVPANQVFANINGITGTVSVHEAILNTAFKYGGLLPGLDARTLRWFLYSIVSRESALDPNHCNFLDGILTGDPLKDLWASFERPDSVGAYHWPVAIVSPDHAPHGCGLTQTTGWTFTGMPYPPTAIANSIHVDSVSGNIIDIKGTVYPAGTLLNAQNDQVPPTSLNQGLYGFIDAPIAVSRMLHPYNPQENTERFMTAHVLPIFIGISAKYPAFTVEEKLSAVAFHWNHGSYQTYDAAELAYTPDSSKYLPLYKRFASFFKEIVAADAWPDGVAGAPTSLYFNLSSGSNQYWIGVDVNSLAIPVPEAVWDPKVTMVVNGVENPVAMTRSTWGQYTLSLGGNPIPANAVIFFKAIVTYGNIANRVYLSPTYNYIGGIFSNVGVRLPAASSSAAPVL
jgi:hypothetical protein